MDGDKLQAALRHHISRNGTVDAARDEQRRFARAARGHTAGTLYLFAVNIGVRIPDLDIHHKVGLVDVNGEMRVFTQQISADLGAYLGGFEREFLIRTLRLDLKGASREELGSQVLLRAFEDNVHILLDRRRS